MNSRGKEFTQLFEILDGEKNEQISLDADLFFIGVPVYAGKFSKSLIRWIHKNKKLLSKKQLVYFTVSLNRADQRPQARIEDDRLLREFVDACGLVPTHVASFAGALKYTQYGFLKKIVMRRISQAAAGPTDTLKDYEFTDWEQVKSFVKSALEKNPESPFLLANRFPLQRNLDRLLPVYDVTWKTSLEINQSAARVFDGIGDIPAKYGRVIKHDSPANEILVGNMARLWQWTHHDRALNMNEFIKFNQHGYFKFAASILIQPLENTFTSSAHLEFRIHFLHSKQGEFLGSSLKFFDPIVKMFFAQLLRKLEQRSERMQQFYISEPVKSNINKEGEKYHG